MNVKKIMAVAFSFCLLAAVASLRGDDGTAPKFQIRLYGGLSYLTGGDVNDGVGGFFQAYAADGIPVGGGFNAAHLGMSFGGDFIFQITPNFGIGAGAGYVRATKDSTMTLNDLGTTLTITGTPQFNAVPIKLGLFFSFPLSSGMNFNFNVGGGYYIAKMTSMIRFAEGSGYEELDNDAKANGFGFQGGIGFDFRIASNVFLFVEAQGQIADFGGFDGTSTDSYSGGYSHSETGKLYYYEDYFQTANLHPIIRVASSPPTESWAYNVREAKVNFSGGQFVVGILFKI